MMNHTAIFLIVALPALACGGRSPYDLCSYDVDTSLALELELNDLEPISALFTDASGHGRQFYGDDEEEDVVVRRDRTFKFASGAGSLRILESRHGEDDDVAWTMDLLTMSIPHDGNKLTISMLGDAEPLTGSVLDIPVKAGGGSINSEGRLLACLPLPDWAVSR